MTRIAVCVKCYKTVSTSEEMKEHTHKTGHHEYDTGRGVIICVG